MFVDITLFACWPMQPPSSSPPAAPALSVQLTPAPVWPATEADYGYCSSRTLQHCQTTETSQQIETTTRCGSLHPAVLTLLQRLRSLAGIGQSGREWSPGRLVCLPRSFSKESLCCTGMILSIQQRVHWFHLRQSAESRVDRILGS